MKYDILPYVLLQEVYDVTLRKVKVSYSPKNVLVGTEISWYHTHFTAYVTR